MNSWWFKDVKNDNPKYSDPRYTDDFCTVPPGLLSFSLSFLDDGDNDDNDANTDDNDSKVDNADVGDRLFTAPPCPKYDYYIKQA